MKTLLITLLLSISIFGQSKLPILMNDGLPKTPTSLNATIGLAEIALSWTNAEVYDSVKIYRGLSDNPTTLLTTIASATSYTDESVIIGRTYYYRVAGVKSNQSSIYSLSANNYAFPDTTAYGGVIYVSKAGSDANNGSKTAPKLTMGSAQTAASAGYCIIVYGGTYYENIASTGYAYLTKGVAWYGINEPIVKSSAATYTVRFDGAATISLYNFVVDGRDSSNSCIISDQSNKSLNYCTLKNAVLFTVKLSGASTTNNNITNCVFEDATVGQAFEFNTLATGTINITGNTFNVSPAGYFMQFYNTNGATVNFTYNTVNLSTGDATFHLNANVKFNCQHNTLNSDKKIITSANAITAGITFKHNTVTSITADVETILLTTANQDLDITIDSNYFYMTYPTRTQPVIYLSNNDSALIRGNHFDTNSETLLSIVTLKSTGNSAVRNQILNNIFLNKSKTGYSISVGAEGTNAYDQKLDSVIIQGNTIYQCRYFRPSIPYDSTSHHAIFVGFNKGADIKYNKVYGSYYGILIKGDDTDSTAIIAYNLLVNNYQGIRIKGASRTNIFNNTLVNNNTVLNGAYLIYLSGNDITWSADSTIMKNNIFKIETGATSNKYLFVATGSTDGLDFDNNLFYSDLTEGWNIGASAYTSMATYQAGGYDASGVNDNPDFTSSTDYSLQTGSPAINAGVDVGLTEDILGNSLVGDPDIGAYEKQ